MVDKDGCCLVSLLAQGSLDLCNEAWGRRFNLVNGYASSGSGRRLDLPYVVLGLGTPWAFFNGSKDTSFAFL